MEKRLQEYRRLKAEKLAEKGDSQVARARPTRDVASSSINQTANDPEDYGLQNNPRSMDENQSSEEERKFKEHVRKIDSKRNEQLSFWEKYYLESILKFLLWASLLGFFIQVGFAAVYFILSMFYFMYSSMSSKSRKGAPSAYSVFNEGCERIDGTFTAEQFENQLRHGALK